jgi:hypothetical protein
MKSPIENRKSTIEMTGEELKRSTEYQVPGTEKRE